MASTHESGLVEGLVKSTTMILISEIGDKTFFIAAIMAMRHPRMTVSRASERVPSLFAPLRSRQNTHPFSLPTRPRPRPFSESSPSTARDAPYLGHIARACTLAPAPALD